MAGIVDPNGYNNQSLGRFVTNQAAIGNNYPTSVDADGRLIAGPLSPPTAPAAPAPAPAAAPAPQAGPKPIVPMQGDLALNKKMSGETNFDERKGMFTAPSDSQKVFDEAQAKGHAPVTQNANAAWGMWKDMSPADMSSYYANAGRQAVEGINKRGAATGTYGSSAASDQTSEALTNLAADRAKAEAQYGLSRMQLGGSLASAADQSSIAASANERGWTTALGGLAQGADTTRLAGEVARQNAADSAEGLGINRIRGLFSDTLGLGRSTSDVIGTANRDIFNNDKDLFGSGVAAGVAPFSEGAAAALRGADQTRSDREVTQKQAAELAKLFK